jgi:hypothetical protein
MKVRTNERRVSSRRIRVVYDARPPCAWNPPIGRVLIKSRERGVPP